MAVFAPYAGIHTALLFGMEESVARDSKYRYNRFPPGRDKSVKAKNHTLRREVGPMKKAAAVCMALLAMALCACGSTGEPDRTGSWGQINQVIKRPDNWQKIVRDDSFSLGKRTLVEGAEGSDDYYFMEYGTYPNIDGSTVCVPLAVEFARQHLGMSDEEACGFVVFNTTRKAGPTGMRLRIRSWRKSRSISYW